jgi:transposase
MDPAARRCTVASTGGPATYYIGIDVSSKESALCILDGKGKIVRETKLPTDPEVIARFVAATGLAIERIGLESGCTAAWSFAGLRWHGWPVTCIDARHAAAALQAGFRNKNDRNDARGIADLMRVNKYRLGQIAGGAATEPPADSPRNFAVAIGRAREHHPRPASPGRDWVDRQAHGL